MSNLTPRQLQVLRLIAAGHTDRAIASQLGVRHSTIKTTKGNLFDRLEAHCAAEAVHIAYRRGILARDPADVEAAALVRLAGEMGYRIALVPLEDA